MNNPKRLFPIVNGLALILTIAVNYLSNAGFLNGETMKTISDRYFNHFTPAGFTFSIWGLIYLGLFGFVIFTSTNPVNDKFKEGILTKVGWWFVVSCLANSLWVVAWLSDYTGVSVLIMTVLLFSLLKIVINTRMELDAHPLKHYLFVFWPFALYSGWVSVALIANVSAYLTKVGWNGLGLSSLTWAIVMVCVAGMVNVFMIYTRNLREFAAVGVWALFGISVSNKNNDGGEIVTYACYTIMSVILVCIILHGLKNKSKSIHNM
ncbi:hypothetical protein QWY86_19170 [Pedobacter aquatilis]|uniref:hypothetical protein n=1 Tax=Pedobacter aquatilis TaxID=351343 RepID=UPI0025B3EAD9|nr:hypothetical protein [Pedobacter aquatilis]MDN3588811.1 hypothetical protein [Pedobacter aquatilis]